MGEAKRRQNLKATEFNRLDEMFSSHNINTSEFSFYDQPEFMEREAAAPEYLSNYARWVTLRPIDNTYASHVTSIVPKLAELLADALHEDTWEGPCVVATAMMVRILDRLKVWSFGVVGSAIFSVPKLNIRRGLHIVDHRDFPDAALGHAWVCAPPFHVVDTTAALQRWGTDPIRDYIPQVILDDVGRRARAKVDDVVSASMRQEIAMCEGYSDPDLHHRIQPNLRDFGRNFPATQATIGSLEIKYIPIAIRQENVALEEINTAGGIGRTGRQLWEDVVKPEFDTT